MTQKNNSTLHVLSIIGGILAALFFVCFLTVAYIIRNETVALAIGIPLIAATLVVNRYLRVAFLEAMTITLYVAGCVLVGFGLSREPTVTFAGLAVVGGTTLLFSRGFLLPFLSVLLLFSSVLGEVAFHTSSPHFLPIAAGSALALFLLLHLYEAKLLHRCGTMWTAKYMPFHAALFVVCIVLLAGTSVNYWGASNVWWLSVAIWAGMQATILHLLPPLGITAPSRQAVICVLCLLICLPTLFAPYLSGSLLLILLCFHYGHKRECAAALLFFVYSISKYYYDLHLSLLVKSITLFTTGMAFMVAWHYFTKKRNKA